MSSIIDKETCEPPTDEKKCKQRKIRSEKEAIQSGEEVVNKKAKCVEPPPPPVVDKVLFDPGSADPLVQERAKCLRNCKVKPIFNIWRECDRRVQRKILYTAETCHEETVDLMEAVDKCVIKSRKFLELE